ncbi:division/cell wall cluster transcriptional repressor MraZ [Methylosoma difficile]
MFRGTSSINIDEKGRFAIPTKYRDELQACCDRKLIVTIAMTARCAGEKGCLWLYPENEWEKVEKTINALPTLNETAINLKRFFIGNATECDMDAQGRLLLPDKLRKYAGMDKKIVLVGLGEKFEVWNEEAFNAKETAFFAGDGSDKGLEELGSLSF